MSMENSSTTCSSVLKLHSMQGKHVSIFFPLVEGIGLSDTSTFSYCGKFWFLHKVSEIFNGCNHSVVSGDVSD